MAQINWTPQANDDIKNIIEYIATQSEKFAKIQAQRIIDKIELLENMPYLGRVVPELNYKNVRELILGSYRIVYHIRSTQRISFITIHHSSRPLDMNKIRPV